MNSHCAGNSRLAHRSASWSLMVGNGFGLLVMGFVLRHGLRFLCGGWA